MRLLSFFLCVLALFGCAITDPMQNTIVSARGPAPSREDGERAVHAWLEVNLKDPDSVKHFRVLSGPDLLRWSNGFGYGNSEGWLMCFEYNAKNSYGAYTGLHHDGLVLRMENGRFNPVTLPAGVGTGC